MSLGLCKYGKSKSYLFVIFQVFLFVAFFFIPNVYHFNFPVEMKIPGRILMAAGVLSMIWAGMDLGKNISAFPEPVSNAPLKTGGIYQYVRHPIYTGLILFFAGIAIAQENLTKLLFAGVFIIFFSIKASYEEKQLLKKFPEYRDYMNKTRSFLLKL